MQQTHDLVLWKNADEENRTFPEIAQEVFDVLQIFLKYPKNFRPNYMGGGSLEKIRPFSWDFQDFKKLLAEGVNRDDKKIFERLGYSISLFSSLDNAKSFGIRMRVGIKNQKFFNTLIVSFPIECNVYKKSEAKQVEELFIDLCFAFKPFWGCISNKMLFEKYKSYLQGKKPQMVHWLNYWGNEVESTIGGGRIQSAIEAYPSSWYKDGVFCIQPTALDVENETDMRYYNQVNAMLGLTRVSMY